MCSNFHTYKCIRLFKNVFITRSYRPFSTASEAEVELNGGRNIESNAKKRVAEKNVEAIPKMQKNILFVLDIL